MNHRNANSPEFYSLAVEREALCHLAALRKKNPSVTFEAAKMAWTKQMGQDFEDLWETGHRPDFCSCSPDKLFGICIKWSCLKHDIDCGRIDLGLTCMSYRQAHRFLRQRIYLQLLDGKVSKWKAWLASTLYNRALIRFNWIHRILH